MADSKLHCPDCDTNVHVGTGGISNLNVHNSKTCQGNKTTKAQPPQKKEKSILNFSSQNSIQHNTPQVISPPPVHAAPLQHESACHPENTTCCPYPSALKLMGELKVGVEAMPKDVEPAPLDHPLAVCLGDPAKGVLGIVEDDWEDILLDYLNLDYDIFGFLYDIPASCFLSFLISFISSDT